MRVLITGAVEGLGRALCDKLLDGGHFVVAVDHNGEELDQLNQLRDQNISIRKIDLSDHSAVLAMLNDFKSSAPFDVAILNAGISATGKFEDISGNAYQKLLQINTVTPMIMATKLAGSDLVTKGGTITFISSLSHATGYPGASVYGASKDAITTYAKSIRATCAKRDINVLTVFPGPVRTSHAERHAPKGADASKRMAPEDLAARILTAVSKRQRVLYPGATAKITRIIGRLFPGTLSKLMRRLIFEKLGDSVF